MTIKIRSVAGRGLLATGLVVSVSTGGLLAASASMASASPSVEAQAKSYIAAYEKVPAHIGEATPLKSKPPTGKTVVYITNTGAQSVLISDQMSTAAKSLGWNVKVLTANIDDPTILLSSLQTALQYHPLAVSFSGAPYQVWSSVLPAYKAAGAVLIPTGVGTIPFSKTMPAQVDGVSDDTAGGTLMADWAIADSNGKANVGFALVPGIGSFLTEEAAVKAGIDKCSGCSFSSFTVPLADLGTAAGNTAVVTGLQRDPSIKYLVLPDAAYFIGLPAALSAAGISGVKITGFYGDVENETDAINGTESAFTNVPLDELGWQVMDTAARFSEGMKIETNAGGVPNELLVKKDLVGTKLSTSEGDPPNYPTQFEKLWHVK